MFTRNVLLAATTVALLMTGTAQAENGDSARTNLDALVANVSASLTGKLEARSVAPQDSMLTPQDSTSASIVVLEQEIDMLDADQGLTPASEYPAAPRVATIAR